MHNPALVAPDGGVVSKSGGGAESEPQWYSDQRADLGAPYVALEGHAREEDDS